MVDDLIGRGLPMYLPKGYAIWQKLERYIKQKEKKLGYLHVLTPAVGTVNLYKTSGHWDHYKYVPTNGNGWRIICFTSNELSSSYDDLCK